MHLSILDRAAAAVPEEAHTASTAEARRRLATAVQVYAIVFWTRVSDEASTNQRGRPRWSISSKWSKPRSTTGSGRRFPASL